MGGGGYPHFNHYSFAHIFFLLTKQPQFFHTKKSYKYSNNLLTKTLALVCFSYITEGNKFNFYDLILIKRYVLLKNILGLIYFCYT